MTDLTTQIDAILHGAAFAPIIDRGFLRITGPDATRWLNGMVTNNIKDLKPGEGNYNFLLNAQGRIQGDCTIYREPDDDESVFMLETAADQIETIHQLLEKFIIMDDVELAPGLYTRFPVKSSAGLRLVGPDAPAALVHMLGVEGALSPSKLSAQAALSLGYINGGQVVVTASPSNSQTTFETWLESSEEANLFAAQLHSRDAIPVSPEALEAYRILSGTPKYGVDIRNTDTNKDLPQETAQTHALNFNKGCYLGQEIVERIHSRGNVHRIFTPFTLTGELPTLPAPLEANGKSAGELTSAVQIGDTIYALGYARREALDTKATLTYAGGTATPRNLN